MSRREILSLAAGATVGAAMYADPAQSAERLGTDLVTLYQALGGGWEQTYPDQPPG